MAIANLLLSLSVTMLIPTLPRWLFGTQGLDAVRVGLIMGAFALGLFLPGPFCSWLVQHYRRNLVFLFAVCVLAVTMLVPFLPSAVLSPSVLFLWRVLQGGAFGLAQMVLSSTLIIDTCESQHRTEANHSATWFGRFALSLGPMFGLLLLTLSHRFSGWYSLADAAVPSLSFLNVLVVSAGFCVLAIVLVLLIHFPFRVPDDDLHLFSLDRFFLPSGFPLFVNLLPVTFAVGLLMSLPLSANNYGMAMVGFLLALLSQHFVFRDADLKSEVVSGLLLIGAALVILIASRFSPLTSPLVGLGLGLVGSRFLLFFIKLSRHCQRGTSQSTFLLGWESGLALGIGMGYACFYGRPMLLLSVSLALVSVSLLFYILFTHNWFIRHKNR